MTNNNYRFKEARFRAYSKHTKSMIYSHDERVAFLFSGPNFTIIKLDEDGSPMPHPLGDDTNSITMTCTGKKDDKNDYIYEGDVVFMLRPTPKGKPLPVIGIVNSKDFLFTVNSGVTHFPFSYRDKKVEVLGNIFQHSDEQLAKFVEDRIAAHMVK